MTTIYGVPVDAAYHLVFGLTTVLTPVLGGLAAVACIVLITVAVRLIVMPLNFRAMRGQAIAARLAFSLAFTGASFPPNSGASVCARNDLRLRPANSGRPSVKSSACRASSA